MDAYVCVGDGLVLLFPSPKVQLPNVKFEEVKPKLISSQFAATTEEKPVRLCGSVMHGDPDPEQVSSIMK
jgi:hypothetical protein